MYRYSVLRMGCIKVKREDTKKEQLKKQEASGRVWRVLQGIGQRMDCLSKDREAHKTWQAGN